MKKVLILSYFYPPYKTGGGLRVKGLGNFLPDHGWEATIITRRLPGAPEGKARVVQTDYEVDLNDMWDRLRHGAHDDGKEGVGKIEKGSSRLKRTMGALIAYPDAQRNWFRPALEAAREVMKEEEHDLILSSSPPQTAHLVARRIKKEHGIPWVADLRDLWTQNHYYLYGQLRKRIERRLELKILRTADALVTVSPYLAQKLGDLHRRTIVHSIPNGFNPDELSSESVNVDKIFSLVFTGTMYDGVRGPQMLFEAVKDLQLENRILPELFHVRLIGPISETVYQSAETMGLHDLISFEGPISHPRALEAQRKAQVLVMFFSDRMMDKYVCPGKLYEYLAAMRPILAFGVHTGDCADVLGETGAGLQVTNKEEAKRAILEMYTEFKSSGTVKYRGSIDSLARFNQSNMAQRFSTLFDTLV